MIMNTASTTAAITIIMVIQTTITKNTGGDPSGLTFSTRGLQEGSLLSSSYPAVRFMLAVKAIGFRYERSTSLFTSEQNAHRSCPNE